MITFSWTGEAWNEKPNHPDTEETTVTIHHDGDFQANAWINVPVRVGDPNTNEQIAELKVPIAALEEFVMVKWQNEIIGFIEEADKDQLKFLCILAKAMQCLQHKE